MDNSNVLSVLGAAILGIVGWSAAIAAPPCPCTGDIDGDCDTDVFDFALFAPAFGTSVRDPGYLPAADLDNSGTIDVFDLWIFAASFGSSVPPGTAGDINGDGVVNVFDFALFAPAFGCGT